MIFIHVLMFSIQIWSFINFYSQSYLCFQVLLLFLTFLISLPYNLILCFGCIECLDLGYIMLFHAFSWLFACDFHCFFTFSGPGKPENYVFCLKASFGVCPATNSCRRQPTPLGGVALEPERLSSSGVGSKRHFPKWRWCILSGVGPVLSEYGPAQYDPVVVTWKIATR